MTAIGIGISPVFGSAAGAGGAAPVPAATYTVTTTGAQTHTINSFGVAVGETVTVDWGDGSTSDYTGTAQRTHNYAGAGEWSVTIYTPQHVRTFTMNDNKVTLASADIAAMSGITTFQANAVNGVFNSADIAAWNPSEFYLFQWAAGSTGAFNSADITAWSPSVFRMFLMPSGYAGTFNSADITAWSPSSFWISQMPSGYAGTFNSADVATWTPGAFYLYAMPSGYAGTFNSANITAWNPTSFYVHTMPTGYAGTFDSADVATWNPVQFNLYAMPSGYTITITAGGFTGFTRATLFDMKDNNLIQADVNTILWDLYQASIAPRTATNGTINVGGSNAAPSGTLQAASACPVTSSTPGKEVAYELVNDSCLAFANHWATVTVTA